MSKLNLNKTPQTKDALEKLGIPREHLQRIGAATSMLDNKEHASPALLKLVALAYHTGAGRVGDELKQFGIR